MNRSKYACTRWYRVRIVSGRVGFPVGTWCDVLWPEMATRIAGELNDLGVAAVVEEMTGRGGGL